MNTVIAEPSETILKYDLSGSNNWVPYFMDHEEHPGILGEVVPQILLEAGIAGEQVSLPAARMVAAIEKGEIDFDLISPSWISAAQFSHKFILSDPVVPIKEYIVQLASTDNVISSAEKILGKEIGTVRGYYYHNDDEFSRHDFSSEKELIQALKSNRIKYAIIGDLPAKYWSKKLDVQIRLSALHSEGHLHIRLRNEHAPLINQFNKAIFKLNESKIIDKISKKYLDKL